MSYKEKYEWLLKHMTITDIDVWERDAMLRMENIYFQFDSVPASKDKAVELAMNDWYRTSKEHGVLFVASQEKK